MGGNTSEADCADVALVWTATTVADGSRGRLWQLGAGSGSGKKGATWEQLWFGDAWSAEPGLDAQNPGIGRTTTPELLLTQSAVPDRPTTAVTGSGATRGGLDS